MVYDVIGGRWRHKYLKVSQITVTHTSRTSGACAISTKVSTTPPSSSRSTALRHLAVDGIGDQLYLMDCLFSRTGPTFSEPYSPWEEKLNRWEKSNNRKKEDSGKNRKKEGPGEKDSFGEKNRIIEIRRLWEERLIRWEESNNWKKEGYGKKVSMFFQFLLTKNSNLKLMTKSHLYTENY